jgi:poly-beta-1,6-N-acetyl-D-glucosamine synthase
MDEQNKISLTVGIPAYNEERNIGKLIQNINSQKGQSFIIDKIFIISDGSVDNTVSEASKFKNVIIIDDGKRKGKALRINEIFQLAQSELVIILDADIALKEDAFKQLIQPFFKASDIMLVSGTLSPIRPKTLAGTLSFVAFDLWQNAIEMAENNEMYHCGGPLRAFKKPFYKNFIFPAITADDVYPYFVCKQMNYQFAYIKNALGFYKLPATITDFKKQQKRFLESESVHENRFGVDFAKQYYSITFYIKFKAFVKTFFKFPASALGYLIVWMPIKINSLIRKPEINGTWDSIISTK